MKNEFPLTVFIVMVTNIGLASSIFNDGFEDGRICWVWSLSVGSDELCIDVPFNVPPPVEKETLQASTVIHQVDVVFGMDTTGSMGGEVLHIKASIPSILEEVRSRVSNSGFAVVGYDDFPYGSYGNSAYGDLAFYLLHRVMTTKTSAGHDSVISAVNLYDLHHGEDWPESGWEMVYQVATGAGLMPTFGDPAFDPATAPPATPPAGEELGEIGGVGFRTGSLPILVWISDAPSHNSAVTGNTYGAIPGATPATSTTALAALNYLGGRIIGILSEEGGRLDLEHAASQTGARVRPDAWGEAADRPPGCDVGRCCTGLGGTGVTPDQGFCLLTFDVGSDGSGVGNAIDDGLDCLINHSPFDIHAFLRDDPNDAVLTLAFVDRLEADADALPPCASGLDTSDVEPIDGIPDTFDDVTPGMQPCFNLILKTNTTVAPTGVEQVFRADLIVKANGVSDVDSRKVFFRVPP